MINAKAWLFLHSASYDGMLFIWREITYVQINVMSGTTGPLELIGLKFFTKAQ